MKRKINLRDLHIDGRVILRLVLRHCKIKINEHVTQNYHTRILAEDAKIMF